MRRIVGIIQARTGSTRLPNKIFLDLAGEPMLKRILDRASMAIGLADLVIAMPESTPQLYRDIVARWGTLLSCPEGVAEDNLVERLYTVGVDYHADVVVRICADNPFIESRAIDLLVDEISHHPELCLFSNAGDYFLTEWPNGIGCEAYHIEALEWQYKYLSAPVFLEHPHRYWHFRNLVREPKCPREWNTRLKIDVNTRAEYEQALRIYQKFGPNVTFEQIRGYLNEANLA